MADRALRGLGAAGSNGLSPVLGRLSPGAAIVFYDWNHKGNPLSLVVMGACQLLVYVTEGLAAAAAPGRAAAPRLSPSVEVTAAAVVWLLFAVWISVARWFVKRQGPSDVPHDVVSLIAGISLFEALKIVGMVDLALAALAVLGFRLTLAFQRYVPGT